MSTPPPRPPARRPRSRRICLAFGVGATVVSALTFVVALLGWATALLGLLGFLGMLMFPMFILAGLQTDEDDRQPPDPAASMMGRGGSGGF